MKVIVNRLLVYSINENIRYICNIRQVLKLVYTYVTIKLQRKIILTQILPYVDLVGLRHMKLCHLNTFNSREVYVCIVNPLFC